MINVVEQSRTCRQHRSPELLARVRDWIEREIRFVELPEFTRPDAATKIQSLRPVSLDDLSESVKAEPGLAFVSGMVSAPLLSPAEELYLFHWMNYLRYRAEQSRQRLNLNRPSAALLERVEADVNESIVVRNQIVRSNLRLVVALARRLSDSLDLMSELIGEATVPLIRAVELFDVTLGNRFSTYATWAVRNHMLRWLKRRQSSPARVGFHDPAWLERVPDVRTNPEDEVRRTSQRVETVRQLLTSLTDRERMVITARFGLDGQPRGQSLQDIADRVGLSKERVRQIALNALAKLRGVATAAGSVS